MVYNKLFDISKFNKIFFKSMPPEKPPIEEEPTTRWQGRKRGNGLLLQAPPTARAALGWPS